jgi:hypothetical protein
VDLGQEVPVDSRATTVPDRRWACSWPGRARATAILGVLLLAVVASLSVSAVAPPEAEAAYCNEALAEYEAAGGFDVLLKTGADVVDFGGPHIYDGKTTASAVAGDAVCASTDCPHGSFNPESCVDTYLYTWIYRNVGSYTINAPGYCTQAYTKGSGQKTFVCTEPGQSAPPPSGPAQPGAPTQPAELPLCNPARGVKPPNCTKAGLKKKRLLDQVRGMTIEFLEFMILDDLRKLNDPNVSDAEKALIIATYFVPVPGGFVVGKLGKQVLRKLGPHFIRALEKAAAVLARSCSLASAKGGRAAQARATACGKKVKQQVARTIAKSVEKSTSPVWTKFKNWREGIKTNGLTGKKREYYKWDTGKRHSSGGPEIEVFDKNGDHKHVIDPILGRIIKPRVPGRTIEVN